MNATACPQLTVESLVARRDELMTRADEINRLLMRMDQYRPGSEAGNVVTRIAALYGDHQDQSPMPAPAPAPAASAVVIKPTPQAEPPPQRYNGREFKPRRASPEGSQAAKIRAAIDAAPDTFSVNAIAVASGVTRKVVSAAMSSWKAREMLQESGHDGCIKLYRRSRLWTYTTQVRAQSEGGMRDLRGEIPPSE